MVSIVLPVHDQADHIESVVASFEAALAHLRCRHELILVSNACRDESPAICASLARSFDTIRVIDTPLPGWGRAVKLGLREAKGSVVGYTNTARTNPDQLATLVLQALLHRDSVVKATRVGRAGLRRVGSSLYNWESRLLFQLASSDINGTPKFFPRHFTCLLMLSNDDDLIDLEFVRICRDNSYPILEVPIFGRPRHGGESTTWFTTAFRLYVGAFRMWKGESK
jgi:glycosyltransferase involved in cell wall biosynthesis